MSVFILVKSTNTMVKNGPTREFLIEAGNSFEVKDVMELLESSKPIGFKLSLSILPQPVSAKSVLDANIPHELFQPIIHQL